MQNDAGTRIMDPKLFEHTNLDKFEWNMKIFSGAQIDLQFKLQ